ncbi:unnamed protein product [Mucor fragilis]
MTKKGKHCFLLKKDRKFKAQHKQTLAIPTCKLSFSNYFPIANYNERGICTNVWHILGKAFNESVLNLEIEQASNASKKVNNKKRKIAVNNQMSRQRYPLVPDMVVLQGEQEYAIIEMSKSSNDIKHMKGDRSAPY